MSGSTKPLLAPDPAGEESDWIYQGQGESIWLTIGPFQVHIVVREDLCRVECHLSPRHDVDSIFGSCGGELSGWSGRL